MTLRILPDLTCLGEALATAALGTPKLRDPEIGFFVVSGLVETTDEMKENPFTQAFSGLFLMIRQRLLHHHKSCGTIIDLHSSDKEVAAPVVVVQEIGIHQTLREAVVPAPVDDAPNLPNRFS